MANVIVLTEDGELCFAAWLATRSYYGAWGKGTGTAAKTDGHLFDEEGTRQFTSKSQPADDTIQHVWTQTTGVDMIVTEAGIFSTQTGYVIIFHATFDGIILSTGDSMEFTLLHQIA